MRSLQRTCLCVLVGFSCSIFAQLTNVRTVVVNDYSGKLPVLQMDDKSYVELKRLVQIAHGTLEYQGNKIIVTLPRQTAAHGPVQAVEPSDGDTSRLSRDFMKAGIEEITLLREWASTLANALQNGYPITENWVANYRVRAQSALAMVSASLSNDADRNAFQLLNREFQAVEQWSHEMLEAQKTMNTAKYAVSDSALHNDPLSQKLVACGHFLGQMLANGTFQDESSCH